MRTWAVVAVVTAATFHASVKTPLEFGTPVPFWVPPFTVLPPTVTSMWTSAWLVAVTVIVWFWFESTHPSAIWAVNGFAANACVAPPSPASSAAAPPAASSRLNKFIPFLLSDRASAPRHCLTQERSL